MTTTEPAISRLRHRADAAMVAMVRRHLPHAHRPSHFARSTLSNLAPKKENAVEEAKQKIDRILARLNYPSDLSQPDLDVGRTRDRRQ